MVAIKLVVLSLACVCATAIPDVTPGQVTRNTIFADERFEGEVFENVDAFTNIELSSTTSPSPYRLPTTTRPLHYNVNWIINMDLLTYSGTVLINLNATQSNVDQIVLHSTHVNLKTVELRQGNTEVPTTFDRQEQYHFLRVNLTEGVLQYNELNPVYYVLNITFDADMRDDMYGIYHSWYRNEGGDGEIRWMATTQFQATAARHAFPCYDEPSFKATFDVIITRPAGYHSWFCTLPQSNVANTNLEGYFNDVYTRTPVMSTYLLALIVADYETDRTPLVGVLRHEVIARRGAIDDRQTEYAQRAGQALLNWMNGHTAYDFYSQSPNLKMTQAAIPDFGAGAMENWGLLTYREAYLLYKEGDTNGYFKQLIAYILSHEIAHMWFGNLVTNDWWDVLWLNEGFARYYQYYLTAYTALEGDGIQVEDMGLDRRFITEQVHTSLLSDSSNNPQPLTNPGVGSPASVSAMFSTITYNKGATVIRMTEHLLGTNVHREGLRNYLRHKQFSTVKPIDLFNELDLAGRANNALSEYGPDFNFVEYYQSWTEQPGHPVLQVNIEHSSGRMQIYQRRFNINTGFSNHTTRYVIPITFTSENNANFVNTKPSHILTEPFTVIDRNSYGNFWTLFNIQQTGFYRVQYDDYTWELIAQALRNPVQRAVIHEFNRAQIVNDVFQFARSGIMTYERAMYILSFLQFETEYVPWVAAITGFNWIRNRLHGNPAQLALLNARIVTWASHAMGLLTYSPIPNEHFMESYLRYQLAPVMCNLGNEQCLAAAYTQFDTMKNGGAAVPVDNRNWVYCNALRRGDPADFDYLWQRFQTHNVYTEKILLLQTLGCTTDDASLITFLDAIVRPNNVIRRQDYTTAFNTAVSGNEENTQKVFAYIQQNLAAVTRAFGSPVTPLSYVSARLRNEAEVIAFQTWANSTQSILGNSYNSVYAGSVSTLESINLAYTIAEDLSNYFVNGDQEFTTPPTPTTTARTTTSQPALAQPTTPELPPSSAVNTFVSIFMLTMAGLAHIIL